MMKAALGAVGLLWLALCAPVSGKDVLLYKVSKGFHYQQTLATSATLLTNNGYVFEAQVNLPLPGTVTSAMVESTEGTDRTLTLDGDDQFEFRNRVNTRATLDTRYPDGPFRMTINAVHDGQKIISLLLTDNAYPPAPRIANLPQLQSINANGYTVIRWDAFAGGTAGDFVQLRIEEEDGDLAYETHDFGEPAALDGTAIYAIIEPEKLKPGQTYRATLRFDKTSTYGISTYVGVPGWSTHHALTEFPIATTSATRPLEKSYSITKGRRFDQPSTDEAIPDLNDEFFFTAQVKFNASNAVTGLTLSLPVGELITVPIPTNSTDWTELTFDGQAEAQELLDQAYPNGTYTFNIETMGRTRAFPLTLTGDAYPPIPHLKNFDPGESVRADWNLVFEWDPWVGGTANDFIQFRIEDANGKKMFETSDFGEKGALTGRATWTMVPAGTLVPGRTYKGRLAFIRVVALDETSHPGSLGIASYYSRTKFPILATPPDLTGLKLSKGRDYRQTDETTVVPDGRFLFSAVASAASTNSLLQSVSLEVPGRAPVALPVQADGVTFSLAANFPTQAALDAAFPNGTYRVVVRGLNDGLRAFTMDLTGDKYPNPPVINEYAATGEIFPLFGFLVSWAPFEDGKEGDFVSFDILDRAGAAAYGDSGEVGTIDDLVGGVLVPDALLLPNAAYTGRVMFERVTTAEDKTYPGVIGRAVYFARTRWSMLTLGEGYPTSFIGFSRGADGSAEFLFPSIVGGIYVIEGSSDLVNWSPVTTFSDTEALTVFRVQPGASHYFYRAVLTR